MTERLRTATERLRAAIQRVWTGHKPVVIAVSAIVVVAIVASGLLLVVVMPGSGAPATASPSASLIAVVSPSPTDSPTPIPSSTPSASPTAMPADWAYSDLDGVAAPKAKAHALPMAVMIDDNTVARPQSGISSASIVYQAYADGGEDRYMFVFQEGTAVDIGPTRSARPYYVYWAAEYKALYAHVGGDAHSLRQTIPTLAGSIYNMDELNGGSCAFHRVTDRPAPHNDYTNSAVLISCAAAKKYPATYQNLPARSFKDDMPLAGRPASQVVSIPYRTGSVGYQYDPVLDRYLRIVDGKTEIDPATGNQVFARTIVVMYQGVGYDPGSLDLPDRPWVYNVGSGKATIIMEGQAIDATWKKASNTALTHFYDSSGKEISFVRGEIFMQSVEPDTAVTIK